MYLSVQNCLRQIFVDPVRSQVNQINVEIESTQETAVLCLLSPSGVDSGEAHAGPGGGY